MSWWCVVANCFRLPAGVRAAHRQHTSCGWHDIVQPLQESPQCSIKIITIDFSHRTAIFNFLIFVGLERPFYSMILMLYNVYMRDNNVLPLCVSNNNNLFTCISEYFMTEGRVLNGMDRTVGLVNIATSTWLKFLEVKRRSYDLQWIIAPTIRVNRSVFVIV